MKPKNSIVDSYKLFLQNIVNFSGRTRRSDFWQVYIVNRIISALLMIIVSVIIMNKGTNAFETGVTGGAGMGLTFGISVIIAIAEFSLLVRRVHDIGKPTWFALVLLVPGLIIAPLSLILMLVFLTKDSEPGANQYGENPKYVEQKPDFASDNYNQTPAVKYCPVCNFEVIDGAAFCPQCGTPLGGTVYHE